jgi:hypothetical protein
MNNNPPIIKEPVANFISIRKTPMNLSLALEIEFLPWIIMMMERILESYANLLTLWESRI